MVLIPWKLQNQCWSLPFNRTKSRQLLSVSLTSRRIPAFGMGMAFAPSRPDTSLTLLRPTLTLAVPPSKFIVWCLPMRILVAEDDAPLAEFLQQRLQQEQFSVQMVGD